MDGKTNIKTKIKAQRRRLKENGSKKKALQLNELQGFFYTGGNGGIRTLDEALHPILP
jgi:hypothetical protein